MKTKLALTVLALLALSMLDSQLSTARAQQTTFTYQGRLTDNGSPANGSYDLRFVIYDSGVGGSQQGPILTNSATIISNGLFTATLDFGNVFPGAARWLDIAVRTNGSGAFTTLDTRQLLTSAPYAITAGSVTSGGLSAGIYGNAVTFSNATNSFAGSFTGSGANVTNVNAATLGGLASSNFWKTGGNSGTSPGANFLGTTDNQPLELRANNQRALRLEPAVAGYGAPNVIGGSIANFVAPGTSGATIGGGGATNYIGLAVNSILSDFGTIGGGYVMTIEGNSGFSTIGGGYLNSVHTNSAYSTIGGGIFNTIFTAPYCTISGGDQNQVMAGANYSTIGGGKDNIVNILDQYSTVAGGLGNNAKGSSVAIGGGQNNLAFGLVATIGGGDHNAINAAAYNFIGGGQSNAILNNADYATIVGGLLNTNGGQYSTIGGGLFNNIANGTQYAAIGGGSDNSCSGNGGATVSGGEFNTASGLDATVPGGGGNVAAGSYSFAAGLGAHANHDGTFVWNDGPSFSSTAPDQFLIHAVGGVGIGTASPETPLHVADAGGITLGVSSTGGGYTALLINLSSVMNGYAQMQAISQSGSTYGNLILQPFAGRVGIGKNNPATELDVNGTASATVFNTTSDRNAKENFSAVNSQEVLDKVAALPITRWNFKDDKAIEHLGPMAQDFHAAFGVGTDDKHIATVDEEGVALAAIQGLNQKLNDQLQTRDIEIADLKSRLIEMERILKKQEASPKTQPSTP